MKLRGKHLGVSMTPVTFGGNGAHQSGAEATAVQTLRDELVRPNCAQRLDCGAFTAALAWRDNQLPHRTNAANISPSPGGEGRGEGGRHTIRL